MAVSTTNPFADGGWSVEGEDPIPVGKDPIPYVAQPYLTGKAWDQYCDPVVYQADKAFREWASHMVDVPTWRNKRINREYRYSKLFHLIFGRPYDAKDCSTARKVSKIFAYYSSTVGKNTYNREKQKWEKGKTCYCISSKCLDKQAYSLRLRVEEMTAKGEIPNIHNMQLPKDDLKRGHSRNPKTEANRQARAERARLAYNEYQRERRRIRAEQEAAQ